jgi:sarcosine oxidase
MVDFDAVVIGLGATGSAALHRLALRGCRVLGIEQFVPGHDRGSSHGETRIIRLGYFEHPSYVPLLRETYALWREIEAASAQSLLTVTGIIEFGAPDSALVAGTLASSQLHALPHEVIDAAELMRRFPPFRLPSNFVGVWQPDGGFLRAEPAIAAQLALAERAGATVRVQTRVEAVEPTGDGVRVVTPDGTIAAGSAIVAAGPWLKRLLPDLAAPIEVTRQAAGWFVPDDAAQFAIGTFPVFLCETQHGIHYGFPVHSGTGFKVAKHHHAFETVDPDTVDREISAKDEGLIRGFLADHLPAGNGPLRSAKTCLYTMTPDGDFILDRLPGAPQVIVASPCSGHGFKFAPVVGDIIADLVIEGGTRRDISRFALQRFR